MAASPAGSRKPARKKSWHRSSLRGPPALTRRTNAARWWASKTRPTYGNPMSEISLEMLTFEQALAELERIVRELENGQIGLEESLTHYEKGVTLLKRCYGQLQQAEQRIVLLKG